MSQERERTSGVKSKHLNREWDSENVNHGPRAKACGLKNRDQGSEILSKYSSSNIYPQKLARSPNSSA